jgi:CRISPR/Cas system CSM-associated protein Csm3 (group 7 of RAMP superfamily)
MHHLLLRMAITTSTPLHTTGNRWVWGADRALPRDGKGLFHIPATTLKGLLRSNAEAILRAWGHRVCLGTPPGGLCPADSLCCVCQVFGNPSYPAPLRFSDAIADWDRRPTIRSGVGISRYRKAAMPKLLFFTETAPPNKWLATAEGFFPSVGTALQAAALVAMAACTVAAVGADSSRGLGWLGKWQVEAVLDKVPVELQALQDQWRAWAGG